MTERVLLLHGIWMRGFMMSRMAKHLAAQGYATEVIDYPSLSKGADRCADDLRARLSGYGGDIVHVVGHSLGGLVALLATQEQAPNGRTVCLGSPLTGSAAAKSLSMYAPWMMGNSCERLKCGIEQWRGARDVGVIAGSAGRTAIKADCSFKTDAPVARHGPAARWAERRQRRHRRSR